MKTVLHVNDVIILFISGQDQGQGQFQTLDHHCHTGDQVEADHHLQWGVEGQGHQIQDLEAPHHQHCTFLTNLIYVN